MLNGKTYLEIMAYVIKFHEINGRMKSTIIPTILLMFSAQLVFSEYIKVIFSAQY